METFVVQIKEAEVRRQVWATLQLRTHLTNKKWKPCARYARAAVQDSN